MSLAEHRHLAIYQFHKQDNKFSHQLPLPLNYNKHNKLKVHASCSGDKKKVVRLQSAQSGFSLKLTCYILELNLITSCHLIIEIYMYTMFGWLYCANSVKTPKNKF